MVSLAFSTSKSPRMMEMLRRVELFAKATRSILILGETGVGKLFIARRIHEFSSRNLKPFLNCNCAGWSPDLADAQMFGYVRGAYTGAVSDSPGIFGAANGGTILFDEIGDMPPAIQSKVLKAVDEQVGYRVGSTKEEQYDFRLIAATWRSIRDADGFRSDLYHRLASLILEIPPLRERMEDLPDLITFMIRKHWKRDIRVSPAVAKLLGEYTWPGNLRELDNVLYRAFILSEGGDVELEHIEFDRRLDHGRAQRRVARRGPKRALTQQQEAEVRQLLDEGAEVPDLARQFSVSGSTIRRARESARRKAA